MVSIKSTHTSSMSTQSLRDLVKLSIQNAVAVNIEVESGNIHEVVFKEFLVEDRSAVGTTTVGASPVIVLFPQKEFEAGNTPVVVFGH